MTDTASGDAATKHKVVVHRCGGGLHHIPFIHCLYEPLHCVLLFPYGKEGWHPALRHATLPVAGQHAGKALAAAEAEAAAGDGQAGYQPQASDPPAVGGLPANGAPRGAQPHPAQQAPGAGMDRAHLCSL